MDQDTLVSEKIIRTGAEFLKRFGERFPFNMAFWLKPECARDWRFHIIVPESRRWSLTLVSVIKKREFFRPCGLLDQTEA